jgi:hypothetical protein
MSGPFGFDFGFRASIFLLILFASAAQTLAATETVEVRVSNSFDDAKEDAGGLIELNNASLELIFTDNNQVAGIRFNNLEIPADAIVSNAYIQFTAREISSVPTDMQITGQSAVDPPTFSGTQFEISSRPTTIAEVPWSPAPWSTAGAAAADQRTPDLSPIIQEIIDLPGWAAGNSVVIMLRGSGERSAESFDGSAGSAALLHVEFESSLGGDLPPSIVIIEPDDATVASEGTALIFSATAFDNEDGDISASLAWDSSIDGDIAGSGASVSALLSAGSHQITATATDSAGQTDSDSITVAITPSGGIPATLDTQILASADDAEENASGAVSLTSARLELVLDQDPQTVGIRFQNINIAPGAVVTDAWIQFTAGEAGLDATDLSVEGIAAANAPSFTNTSFDISSRPRTDAQVDWQVAVWPTLNEAGTNQRTPNLANIINEILSSGGWADGNALAFVVTGNGKRVANAFDGSAQSAPMLHIEYVADTPEEPPVVEITGPADGTNIEEGTAINFTATANDAQDGSLNASIIWSSSLDGSLGTGESVNSVLSLGGHTITASAVDSASQSGSSSIGVNVTPVAGNLPIVTIISPADGISLTNIAPVSLSGSAYDDEDGDLSAAITWTSSLDGALGTGASINASLSVGAHTITASIADAAGQTDSQSISINVTPDGGELPKTFIASPKNGISVQEGSSLTFWGFAGDNEDGPLSDSIVWTSSLDGELGIGLSATATLSVGVHTITASVTDSGGQTGSSFITVTVTSLAGLPPSIAITAPADGSSVIEGTPLTFTGAASDNEDGDLSAAITWTSSLDGALGTGASVNATLSLGSHTVTAGVSDVGGQQSSASINVTVTSLAGNVPQISITAPTDGTSVVEGTPLTFTGTASDTEDGDLSAAITWTSSLDGALGTGASVNATLSLGSHTVTASVSDAGGQEVSAPISITITPTGGTAQTITSQVASGTDDAEEFANGDIYTNSSDLELVFDDYSQEPGLDDYNQTVGMRFNNITIEPGSVVTNAWIQFTVDETSSEPTSLVIQGEASPDAAGFSTTAFSISSRPRTTAQVSWAPNSWTSVGAAGADQKTPDLSAVINEIIADGNWAYGNSVVILVTGSGKRVAESANGSAASAPVLHVEFVDSGANRRPVVDAGSNLSIALPDNTVTLNGTVSDDGLPEGSSLATTWSHVGGTGTGTVSFGNRNAVDTTATFSDDPGTYILELSASDGEYTTTDDITVTVRSASSGGQIVSISQAGYFDTGFANLSSPLAIPATDPAGVVYHPPSGRLFIVDSEINEILSAFDIVQANVFQTPTAGGTTFAQWDTTVQTGNEPSRNREPTGIAYCENDGHFYVSNDDQRYIYRYAFDGTNLTAVDSFSVSGTIPDAEGITCDPATGRLYLVGGVDLTIGVLNYDNGFSLEEVISIEASAGSSAGIPEDAEGIAFDPASGHLFVLSGPDRAIFEYTTEGVFIQKFDIGSFSPRPSAAQGLSIGVASDDPGATSFYIADGMIDNNSDPNERDGRIFEARIYRE